MLARLAWRCLAAATVVACAIAVASPACAQVALHRPPPSHALFAGVPPTMSRVLLDLRITDAMHSGMMSRVAPNGGAFLPLERALAFTGVHVRVSGSTISATADGARPALRVDVAKRTARIGHTTIPLTDADLLVDGPTVYASTALLGKLLGIGFDFDLSNAIVQLRNVGELPIVRRQTALDEAARSSAVSSAVEAVQVLPSRLHTNLQTDYTLFIGRSTSGAVPGSGVIGASSAVTTFGVNARFAARVSGGAVTGSVGTAQQGRPFQDVRWTRVRPGSTLIKRIVIGELDQRAALATRTHGISIDNYPVDLSEQRLLRVRGRADPGWSYSVRQGASWLGGSRPDESLYEFLLPIAGDARRVDIVAWGPNGEERRIARSVRALPVRVQRGDFQYAVAAGRCDDGDITFQLTGAPARPCRFVSSADGTFGITDWFAARSGVDVARGAVTPYAGAAIVLRQSLMLQATRGITGGRGAVQSWSAQYDPSPAVSVGFSRNVTVDGRRTDFTSARLTPVKWAGRFGLDGFLATTTGLGAPSRVGRVAATSGFHSTRLEVFGVRTMTWSPRGTATSLANVVDAVGVTAQASPDWLRLPRLQRTSLAGSVDRTSLGETRSLLRLTTATSRTSIELSRQFGTPTQPGRWSILFSPRSLRARQTLSVSRSDATASQDAQNNAVMTMAGGAAWNAGDRTLTLSAEQSTGRGSITGTAFLDLNDNGTRDDGEPVIPDVPLTIANRSLRTDSSGRFRAGNLGANEQVEITVDSMALPSPCWRAAASRWRVRAMDGGTAHVMLPLRRGGVLEGRVLRVQRSAGTFRTVLSPWVDPPNLTAISTTSGRSYPLEVFGSGSFYMLGIPFGAYEIVMQEADQRRNNIVLKPAHVTVASTSMAVGTQGDDYATCPSTVAILRTVPRDAGEYRRVASRSGTTTTDSAAIVTDDEVATARPDSTSVAGDSTALPRDTTARSIVAVRDSATIAVPTRIAREAAAAPDTAAEPGVERRVRTQVTTRRAGLSGPRTARVRRAGTLRRRHMRSARHAPRAISADLGGHRQRCDPFSAWRLQLRHVNYTLEGCVHDFWRKEPEFDGRPLLKPRRMF